MSHDAGPTQPERRPRWLVSTRTRSSDSTKCQFHSRQDAGSQVASHGRIVGSRGLEHC